MPCNLVQMQCKLHTKSFVNITLPFFWQCMAFSASVSARSPALLCMQHTAATKLGLVECLASSELPELKVLTEGDGSSLVAFREYGHDAPDVAHSFTSTDSYQTKELGVLAPSRPGATWLQQVKRYSQWTLRLMPTTGRQQWRCFSEVTRASFQFRLFSHTSSSMPWFSITAQESWDAAQRGGSEWGSQALEPTPALRTHQMWSIHLCTSASDSPAWPPRDTWAVPSSGQVTSRELDVL